MSTATPHESGQPNFGECSRIREATELSDKLDKLRDAMHEAESRFSDELSQIHSDQRPSARNLLHYVALRRHDIRPLQEQLVHLGLSSLGRCESYVLENVEAVLGHLGRIGGREIKPSVVDPIDSREGRKLIETRTADLLGPKTTIRGVQIMVTMPTAAASDYRFVRDLLAAGMNCMRINCAHDDESLWSGMIGNLRRAEKELSRTCRVMMDLGGPKIRTGPIEPGPQVIHWRPHRDALGRTIAPARIWLTGSGSEHEPPARADGIVPVEASWVAGLQIGHEIRLSDTRDQRRSLRVIGRSTGGVWAECGQTTYLVPGTPLELFDGNGAGEPDNNGRVGPVPPIEQPLILHRGDRIHVTGAAQIGRRAIYDDRGKLISPATIGCTLPEIIKGVRVGERILFDDGKIGGVVEEVHDGHLVVEISHARIHGEKLRSDKGINLPDSHFDLPALTDKDLQDLQFVVKHADAVSYSFVRSPDDVYRLQAELTRLGRSDLGIILKIENNKAVERLARLLLAVMRSPEAGVMIARGDLAIECGWQRLAEVQEEILWTCEAAHMPVVWATQVLESMAKKGLPSRAEVTDAAMGVRAECVMLNKGPHIVETVRALDDILRRMQDHQVKKRPMLRKLSLADDLLPLND